MLLFFNISPGELVVAALAFLMIFGSKNIPSIARFLGRASRQVKDATADIKREFTDSAKEVTDEIKETRNRLDQLGDDTDK